LPSRRDFLKFGGVFGLGALAGGGITYYSMQSEISKLNEALKESSLNLEPELNVYNWYDYVAPGIFEDFTSEFNVKLNPSYYGNPDEMFAKVMAGGSGFDVVIASDYKVGEMIPLNLLQKLDFEKIPNFINISDEFTNPPYDPSQEYSLPYMWGTTGIGYNKEVVTEDFDGFDLLFEEDKISKYSKKVVLVDEMREVFAAALKYLGYSLNETKEERLVEAKNLIMKIKPYILKFSAEQVKELLISGDVAIALGYSTDVYLAAAQNESIQYKIAKEGGTMWIDNFVLLNEAKNVNSAHKFIDYMLRPSVCAINSNYLFIANPCFETVERGYVLAELAEDPNIYPPEDILKKMEVFKPFTIEEKERMGQLWTEIKA